MTFPGPQCSHAELSKGTVPSPLPSTRKKELSYGARKKWYGWRGLAQANHDPPGVPKQIACHLRTANLHGIQPSGQSTPWLEHENGSAHTNGYIFKLTFKGKTCLRFQGCSRDTSWHQTLLPQVTKEVNIICLTSLVFPLHSTSLTAQTSHSEKLCRT